MASTSRFASLMGFGAKKAATEDKDDKDAKGEKPVQRDDESDEDYQKRVKEWEDKDDDKDAIAQPAAPAATVSDEDIAAAHEEGVAAGIAAERVRWTTVLSGPEAVGKAAAACDLLADSDMDAAAINKFLGKQAPPRSTLADRNPKPTPAPATGDHEDPSKQPGAKGFGARVAAAVEKAGGLRRGAKKS